MAILRFSIGTFSLYPCTLQPSLCTPRLKKGISNSSLTQTISFGEFEQPAEIIFDRLWRQSA